MRAADLTVELTGFDDPVLRELPAATQLAIYRIAQEALTNALRHAGTVARIRLVRTDGVEVVLAVEHAPAARPTRHPRAARDSGIPGMSERVRAVGGTLEAGPTRAAASRSSPAHRCRRRRSEASHAGLA